MTIHMAVVIFIRMTCKLKKTHLKRISHRKPPLSWKVMEVHCPLSAQFLIMTVAITLTLTIVYTQGKGFPLITKT